MSRRMTVGDECRGAALRMKVALVVKTFKRADGRG